VIPTQPHRRSYTIIKEDKMGIFPTQRDPGDPCDNRGGKRKSKIKMQRFPMFGICSRTSDALYCSTEYRNNTSENLVHHRKETHPWSKNLKIKKD